MMQGGQGGDYVNVDEPRGIQAFAEEQVRRGFVRKVYGILSAQLLLTTAIAAPIAVGGRTLVAQNPWLPILSSVLLLVTMCSLCCCSSAMKVYPYNYLMLFGITVAMSLMTGLASAQYTWQSVVLAFAITSCVFLVLTALAAFTSIDFTGMGVYLYAGLASLFCFSMVLSILILCGVQVKAALMLYNLIGVVLFTFYIVYDTQLILGGKHKQQFAIDDYAFAALNIYLDIINMFLYILELVGERK